MIFGRRRPGRAGAKGRALLAATEQISDRARRAQRYRELLAGVSGQDDPLTWAILQIGLGDCLAGGTAEDLEEGLAAYQAALTVLHPAESPTEWGWAHTHLGIALRQRTAGVRLKNLELAIQHDREALRVFDREATPEMWALVQNNLGNALLDRGTARGRPGAEDIEQAITCFEAALAVLDPGGDPLGWAGTIDTLGRAYMERQQGGEVENLHKAIDCLRTALSVRTVATSPVKFADSSFALGKACKRLHELTGAGDVMATIGYFEAALAVYDAKATPREWARVQYELGELYKRLGDRLDNVLRAIGCYESVLPIVGGPDTPMEHARALLELGRLYGDSAAVLPGGRAAAVERSIGYLTDALKVLRRLDHPQLQATAKMLLAWYYTYRVKGIRADNLEQAVALGKEAMQAFARQGLPIHAAIAAMNLAIAYWNRVVGTQAENQKDAIAYCRRAVDGLSRDERPLDWAKATTTLGALYLEWVDGDRRPNVENSIRLLGDCLQVLTPEEHATEWAIAKLSLANAYRRRVDGDPTANIEAAITQLNEARAACDRRSMPVVFGMLEACLGMAYYERVRGDPRGNVEHAIEHFQAALTVYTPEDFPLDRARVQVHLGMAHADPSMGASEEQLQRAIACYDAALAVCSKDRHPVEWAAIRYNLGRAYHQRSRLPLLAHPADDQEQVLRSLADVDIEVDLPRRPADIERSIGCFADALRFYEKQGPPERARGAKAGLADAYQDYVTENRSQHLEKAIALYEEILDQADARPPATESVRLYDKLGDAYLLRTEGDPPNSSENLERAIACYEQGLALSATTVERLSLGAKLGRARARAGRWRKACQAFEVATEAADAQYAASLLRASREMELGIAARLRLDAAEALVRYGRADEAVVVLERARAQWLGKALAGDPAKLRSAAQHNPGAYDAYRRTVERIRALEELERRSAVAPFATLEPTGGIGTTGQPLRGRREADLALLGALEQAYAALDAALNRIRKIPGFERFLHAPTLDDIAAAARPGVPLAYLAAAPHGPLALVVHQQPAGPSQQAWTRVVDACQAPGKERLTARELHGFMLGWDAAHQRPAGYLTGQARGPAELLASLDHALPRIGEQVAGPLAASLRTHGAHGVKLIACGVLGWLPVHAAPYRRDGGRSCLLDEFEVAFAPSARVLTSAQALLSEHAKQGPVLAGVGNPSGAKPLPFGEAELAEIATTFPTARLHYGPTATKEALFSAAAAATHIHLACHALADPVDPVRSSLALAGARLSLLEILAERPFSGARMVVASACQTALSVQHPVPDEAMGFLTGFLYAGTPGVLGTLWPVEDLSTALLMTRFYELHLNRDPDGPGTGDREQAPAAALGAAQRWLRDLTGGQLSAFLELHPRLKAALGDARLSMVRAYSSMRPYAHPYHWAPYVMVGE